MMVWGLRKIKSSGFGLALGGCQHKLRKLECAVLGHRLERVSGLGLSLAFLHAWRRSLWAGDGKLRPKPLGLLH